MSSREELESFHKKTLKSLEGEKRAAIKKAKGTKGKKAKEALAAVEEDFSNRLTVLQAEFEEKLKSFGDEKDDSVQEAANKNDDTKEGTDTKELSEKEKKQLKARKKKERQKEREIQRELEIEQETANAGPSMREVELDQIQAVLTPLSFAVAEVEADGHCLYRAVAAQTATDFQEIRSLCADTILQNEAEFAPFCEFSETVTSFGDYVSRVRNSADWGGHLELRALSRALKRPIHVYSVQSGGKPLEIHDELTKKEEDQQPIRLSYHLHYYALGEHYNQVVETK